MKRLFIALWLLFAGLPADATEWAMDAESSHLQFVVTYTGQETPGVFRRFDTRLDFDPANPATGRLDVIVDITSADMDSADINDAIAAVDWFDFAGFPEARFTSSSISITDQNRYEAVGHLQLKGIDKEIVVPFRWVKNDTGAVLDGELVLDRSDYSIGTGEWATGDPIGLEVRLRFSVLLKLPLTESK